MLNIRTVDIYIYPVNYIEYIDTLTLVIRYFDISNQKTGGYSNIMTFLLLEDQIEKWKACKEGF